MYHQGHRKMHQVDRALISFKIQDLAKEVVVDTTKVNISQECSKINQEELLFHRCLRIKSYITMEVAEVILASNSKLRRKSSHPTK